MAWGSKTDLLHAENAAMTREIEMLREQLTERKEEMRELKQQLMATQEALIAKESPEAYRDQKDAEVKANAPVLTDEEREAQRRQHERSELASRYIQELEEPLFKDADDMIQHLTRATGVPLGEPQSLHGNDES